MSNHTNRTNQTGHAIVIGGSIAGLLTARVLTNHFAQVTVVERDTLPETPDFRKGAPHARHAHGLLVRGQQIMESFFPGLGAELESKGALPTNMGTELALSIGGVVVKQYASDLVVPACSRALLEHVIGQRLRTFGQIRFREGHDVAGLCTDAARTRVTGVRLRQRGDVDAAEEVVDADLVVDASGRSSRLPSWLADLGYAPPAEITVDAKAGYATRLYRRPPSHAASWKALYSMPQAPHQSRGCIVLPMEADVEGPRWQVTLTGLNGDHPPTDAVGFLAFARTLPVPGFYEMLRSAEPLTDPYGYQRASNRLRHYDSLPRFLEGMLALGDSVCAFNPVYGQGMTVAALGAVTLDECLGSHRRRRSLQDPSGLARAFQRKLAKVVADPWQMATGQDLRWAVTASGVETDPVTRLVQRYFDHVLVAMTENGDVAATFAKVQNMVASPVALFHPRIVWQVIKTAQKSAGTERVTPVSFNNTSNPTISNPTTEKAGV